ncbi:uncharacterized protein ACA1_363420 [Acanthamoeba castellanii str. Neff]|uniref:Uncharacterized protein n=1 Tax=Acanthamoeba castellanii (strain ATCC 30010 / Neff) TaxID=1257118 RepID=L8GFR4_ACACF|nr:uncharacterized protein ACA1_363420 [Acanthamoeba castellanii str. Neff]ELR11842.1 hypothetical protein ACA1_363420 [Acanthamoeba castellanii str. Neff]
MTYKANITSGGSGAEFSDALARRYTELVANSTSQWFDIVMDYYRVMADMSVSFAYAVSYGAENSAVISSNMNALSLRALRDVITEVDSTSASLAIDHRENKRTLPISLSVVINLTFTISKQVIINLAFTISE